MNRVAAFLAAVASIVSFSLPAVAGPAYYVLQGVDKTQPDSVISNGKLTGFTIRVSWDKLYREGFSWLDQQVARADKFDKSLQLRVMAGDNSPLNLPGVKYFNYSGKTVPVPWDAAAQAEWAKLMGQLGARYGSNPRIKIVHAASFADSSEMHMPPEVTKLAGYSSHRLAESWIGLASPLAAAFPNSIVSLNYAPPGSAQISSADSTWLLNQLAAIAPGRAGYQVNDLSAKSTLDRAKYQTIVQQHNLGRHVGFQMLSISTESRFGGKFSTAVATGTKAGAEWLEIYAADVAKIYTSPLTSTPEPSTGVIAGITLFLLLLNPRLGKRPLSREAG